MKKNIYIYSFLIAAFFLVSCDSLFEDELRDYQEYKGNANGITAAESNVVNGFFDLTDVANATSGVTITFTDGGASFSSADIYASFKGGARAKVGSTTSNPAVLTFSLTEVATALGVNTSTLEIGDEFIFTYDVSTTDGQVIATQLSTSVKASCASNLGGTYTFVSSNLQASNSSTACPTGEVTGSVTFTDLGGGRYLVSDLGFGQYESTCWSDGPATSANAIISDVCNKITTGGLDQYSLTYIWTITNVDGSDLYISWSNDYGDSGNTILTRTDGTDWPELYTE